MGVIANAFGVVIRGWCDWRWCDAQHYCRIAWLNIQLGILVLQTAWLDRGTTQCGAALRDERGRTAEQE